MNGGYRYYHIFGTEVDSNGVDSAVPLYMRHEAGWPLNSFDGEFFMTARGIEPSFMLNVPQSMYEKVENYFLPFKPTVPGFVVNSAIYGGVPWLLFCGPFVLRRSHRRKRKQCIACGYPIGNSDVCTECGNAIATS